MNVGPYDDEIATLALIRKDFDFLFKYCEEEIKRNPENWRPYDTLATVHSMLFIVDKDIDRVKKSIEYRKKALELLGDRFPRRILLSGLGDSYVDIGHLDLAKKAFIEAEGEPSIQEETRLDLLEIALKERDRAEAERLFNLLPDDFKRTYHRFDLAGFDKAALRKLIDETFKKE